MMSGPRTLSCVRIHADSTSSSHYQDYELGLERADLAPSAPPLQVSEFEEAARYGFAAAPAGWTGEWHPAPRRQVALTLAAELDVEVGDGAVRRFGPGSVVLLDDTTGTGHATRVVGSNDALLAFARLDWMTGHASC